MAATLTQILTVLVMAGAAVGEGRISYQDPPRYQFQYSIKDSSEPFGHSEQRDLGRTEGEYFVQLPDGRMKTVTYVADDSGYHPKVVYKDSESQPNSHTPIYKENSKSPLWPEKQRPSYHSEITTKSTNPPYRPTRSKHTGFNSIRTTLKPLTKPKFSHRLSKPIYTTAIPPTKPNKPFEFPRPSYVTTPTPSYDIHQASYHHYKPLHLSYTPIIPNKASIPNSRPDYRKVTKSPIRYGDNPTPSYSQVPGYPSGTGPIPIGLVPTFHSQRELFPRPSTLNKPSSPQPLPHKPRIFEPTPDQFFHPQKPFQVNPSIFNPLPPIPSYLQESPYDSRGPSVVPRVVAVPIPIEKHNEVHPLRQYQLGNRSQNGRSLSNFESKRRSNLSSSRRPTSSSRNQLGIIRSSSVLRNDEVIRLNKTTEDELDDYDEAAQAYI